MENKVDIKKRNSEISWLIADRWFRILEFSLILGILHYIEKNTGNLPVRIIYWISWALFWSWFQDIGELIFEAINSKKKLNRIKKSIVWLVSTILVAVIYYLVTYMAELVIKQQNL